MCLTANALAAFLNLLNPDIITSDAKGITVHATEQAALWTPVGDKWCTQSPRLDRFAFAQ